jgi:hypothetical protein
MFNVESVAVTEPPEVTNLTLASNCTMPFTVSWSLVVPVNISSSFPLDFTKQVGTLSLPIGLSMPAAN